MKRILAIILSACFIVALAGCRNNVEDVSSITDATHTQTDSSDALNTANSNSDLTSAESSSEPSSTQSNSEINSAVTESGSKETGSSKTETPTPSKKEETVKSNEYNVTFDFGYDGKKVTVQTVNHDVIAVAPDVPSRKGYKFVAWYKGDQQLTYDNRTVNCDTTFVGHWSTPSYQILYNFDTDGLLAAKDVYIIGMGVPYDSDKTSWGTINSPPVPYDKSMREYRISMPSTYDVETETITIGPIVPENMQYSDRVMGKDPSTFGFLTDFEFVGWTYADKTVPQKTVTIPKGSTGSYHFFAHWQPKNP